MAKTISNIIYIVGVVSVLYFLGAFLFGPGTPVNPEAMIPMTGNELSFMWLAAGSIPMLLACMAVYKFNKIKNSVHKKRNFVLIFLPCFICGACLLFVIGLIGLIIVNFFFHVL